MIQGCASSMNNTYISSQDVKDVMKILELLCIKFVDLILSHTLLKASVDILYLSLSTVFDKSLSVNVFPAKLKMANVILIYKSKDSSNITNYRPIYTSTIKSPSAVQMSKSIKQTQSVDKVYYNTHV